MNIEDNSIYYFLVPVALVIAFNFYVTIRVVYQIAKISTGPAQKDDVKAQIR